MLGRGRNIDRTKKIVANFILNLEYKRNEYFEEIPVSWEVAEDMEPEEER